MVIQDRVHNLRDIALRSKNSSQQFSQYLNEVLSRVENYMTNVWSYIDDIMVASSDANDHIRTLNSIFKGMAEGGIKLKLTRCEL